MWEIPKPLKNGDSRTSKRFAVFPTKVKVQGTKDHFVTVWLYPFFVLEQWNEGDDWSFGWIEVERYISQESYFKMLK